MEKIMAVIANRRSVMTLFSDATCPQSHRVRMVLAEKGITVEIVNIDPDNLPEDLIDLNPYQSVPTLVDRELVLYGCRWTRYRARAAAWRCFALRKTGIR